MTLFGKPVVTVEPKEYHFVHIDFDDFSAYTRFYIHYKGQYYSFRGNELDKLPEVLPEHVKESIKSRVKSYLKSA